MKNTRNKLNNKRQDAKELIKLIERLPENKKAEMLGIIKGYSLCAENEEREKEEVKMK